MIDVLSWPAWQGAGVLVALVGLILYVWFDIRRRNAKRNIPALPPRARDLEAMIQISPDSQSVRYFAIVDEESERRYYEEIGRRIRDAKEAVYRTGRGFQHPRRSGIFSKILAAEDYALQNGVDMIRIQMGSRIAPEWADGLADLLERYDRNLRVVADLDNVLLNDACLIDPHGHRPIVNFLFESREPLGSTGRPVIAIIIENARALADTLAQQMVKRANELPRLQPDGVRDLARSYIYFGWGVHMSTLRMLRDVPDAQSMGVAVLRGWQRDVQGVLAGPADRATIRDTGRPEDTFEGVAYELSWWGKALLDRLERRAYEEIPVTIDIKGKTHQAFTYVPLPPATTEQKLVPGSWIWLVVEGAEEHQMHDLLTELRTAGVPVDGQRRGAL